MLIEVTNPEAVQEVEQLMERFSLSATEVVEAVLVEAGCWMPMEMLGFPKKDKVEL